MAFRNQNLNCSGKFAGAKGPCVGPATLRCGNCGAPNYCSRPHQIAHWKEHQKECSRMAQQMARAGDLVDFPFTFTAETTQLVDEGAVSMCSFLEKRELHLKGLWQGECQCAGDLFKFSYAAEWQLLPPMCPCRDPVRESGKQISDWKGYYEWRELPFNSPVALLLQWPLTLYHALGLISERIPTVKAKFGSQICVHYLGPEKELQLLPVFAELMALLPGTHVHIDMIGPAVPASRDGDMLELAEYPECLDPQSTCKDAKRQDRSPGSNGETESEHHSAGRVTVKLWQGLYHDRYQDLVSPPDLVLAPNAGLAAFPTWQPTIKLLTRAKIRSVFTDYCEEAADLAASALSVGHSETLTYPVQPNPFRQPFSVQAKLLNLPTYSNCFIFGMG